MRSFGHSRAKGDFAEQAALDYLRKQGLNLVEQNFNCRYGEIDILMRDAQEWVFVEVRYRQSQSYGGGLESVDRNKQRKLINTAEYYIQNHPETRFDSCRFDMLEISGDIEAPQFNWIQDAFRT